jgi:hypothetical protein
MSTAKSPIRLALVAAIPVEAINFFFAMFPVDVGLPPDAKWYTKATGFEWLVLHWPGLWLGHWMDNTRFEWLEAFLWAACGYLDTVIVIIAGILVFRLLRHARRHQDAAKATL